MPSVCPDGWVFASSKAVLILWLWGCQHDELVSIQWAGSRPGDCARSGELRKLLEAGEHALLQNCFQKSNLV